MTYDRNGLEVLDKQESLALLRGETIGRVLVTGALPAAFPVNYALVGDDVVLRTGVGTKLRAAATDTIVGFEVDAFEPQGRRGWSVLVIGHAREIEEPSELVAAGALTLQSWVPSVPAHFVKISTQLVTGRRLGGAGPVSAHQEAALPTVEPPPWLGPAVDSCRACGCSRLLAISDGDQTNFICNDCAACWHVEQGWMYRVNPATCPGCSFKAECSRAYLADAVRLEEMAAR